MLLAAVVCSGVVHLQHGDKFRVVLEIQKWVEEKENVGVKELHKAVPS